MQKKYLLLSLFFIALISIFNTANVNSKITNPPFGSSGDPITNLTCAQPGCHATAFPATERNLSLLIGTGLIPTDTINVSNPTFRYSPNTLYHITFKLNSFTGRYGFQLTSLDATPAHEKAGDLAVVSANTTKINTNISTGTRQYMGHLNANTTKTWTFNWTAPAAGTGNVTFYYAYNTANADATPIGDSIFVGSSTIQEGTTGINDISNKISSLTVFPNPINNDFSLSFNMKEANRVSAQLYSLDGKLSKELMNDQLGEGTYAQTFDINTLESGIYLIKLTVDETSVTHKIIKQ